MRTRSTAAALLLILWTGACLADQPPPRSQVRRIRYWTAPDHTRVVLDMSSESTYRISTRTGPHRVVIDIPAGKFSAAVKPLEVGDGVLDRIRINRLRSGAQIVLDLPAEVPFKHFPLRPNRYHPHRIVVDLKRPRTSEELKQERLAAEKIARSGDYVVIIDPGHGGSKPGVVSRRGLKEKNVALKLSRLTAREINRRKGYRAVLTRDGDYNVDLGRRIGIARSHCGNCFISIHHNGNERSRPRGTEVYFLSLAGASAENAESVAERENMLLEMGEEGEEIPDDLKSILFDLNRTNIMNRSSLFAAEMAASLERDRHFPFRGVRQDNFIVLRSIAMPSVLIEIGFLSNRKDENLLRSEKVLGKVAALIADGVVRFLDKHPPGLEEGRESMVHVVSAGETLWGIARKYGVTIESIRTANRLERSSTIRPGQKLRIYY